MGTILNNKIPKIEISFIKFSETHLPYGGEAEFLTRWDILTPGITTLGVISFEIKNKLKTYGFK